MGSGLSDSGLIDSGLSGFWWHCCWNSKANAPRRMVTNVPRGTMRKLGGVFHVEQMRKLSAVFHVEQLYHNDTLNNYSHFYHDYRRYYE